MSQRSRDEKLASAKKTLKKFQESNKIKNVNDIKSDDSNKIKQIASTSVNEDQKENNVIEDVKESTNDAHLGYNEPNATNESFKQLSRQLNGILSCSNSSVDRESQAEYIVTIRDLEKRNVELATLNSQKLEQIEILNEKIKYQNGIIDKMKDEFNQDKESQEASLKVELESNRNKLQAQIHTISLYAAEKSELQGQLTHKHKVIEQMKQEIDDFSAKLKVSRQKVADLETLVNELKSANEKSNEARKDMSRQLEQLRNNIKKYKTEKDDLMSECSQYKSKLLAKTQEVSNLEINLDDVNSQLEMCRVQIQHLTNNQGQYDDFYSKLKVSEKKIEEMKNELTKNQKNLTKAEAENLNLQRQYKIYFEQMEEKISNLELEMKSSTSENESLKIELDFNKKALIDLQNKHANDDEDRTPVLEQENELLKTKIIDLKSTVKLLEEKQKSLHFYNERLAKINEEIQENNYTLSERNSQLETSKLDYNSLLDQLQSDKTTLSRSLSQNKELKSQLFELQEAFVKMSSDNMDLSTSLQHEQHVNKELACRLGEQEDELNDLRIILSKRDEELKKLAQSHYQLTEEILTNESSSKSQDHIENVNQDIIKKLENEIQSSQERINHLINENNLLKMEINKGDESHIRNQKNEDKNSDTLILNLRQIEAERNELLSKCENLQEKELRALERIKLLEEANNVGNGDNVSKAEFLNLQTEYKEVMEKYKELKDKMESVSNYNKQLELVVAQLEGETDTIGEYITLYQSQRAKLKQRNMIKEQLFSKLDHQKKLFARKVAELENLLRAYFNPNDQEHKNDLSPSQIFKLIQELKKSEVDVLSESCRGQSIESTQNNQVSSNTDDFNDYKIIHCKCCVGKIIDL